MSTFHAVMSLADQINKGENGAKYAELRAHCQRFLLWIRMRFKFHAIPYKVVVDELTDEAIQDAFVACPGCPDRFVRHLQNAFRKRCRDRLRISKEEYLLKLARAIEDYGTRGLLGIPAAGDGDPPDTRMVTEEDTTAQVERRIIATRLLEDEDRECQKMIMMKSRGASDPQIAERLRSTAEECKRTRQNNIRRMRRRMEQLL